MDGNWGAIDKRLALRILGGQHQLPLRRCSEGRAGGDERGLVPLAELSLALRTRGLGCGIELLHCEREQTRRATTLRTVKHLTIAWIES